ncbi:heavy metal translocating P-type ATPase [uncultured Bifidobacterium sp.]|uniref:heavy metal translocating P-type ATPase n=1 Tax=uncultured Bifidobacterium sp. TaxID=165187 RepID=UPI00260634A9|nr:heavy metal translocating P-type ATPase [uncultured Bifidobacterium sp.]
MRRIVDRVSQVPMLAVTVISVFPIALLWGVRWGWTPFQRTWLPSIGQSVVVAVVVATVVPMVVDVASDLLHGKAGVDVLAIMALVSTLLVGQYWASWAVALMVWSGDAIERYANGRATSSLNALVSAAPRQAHVVTLRGVGSSGRARDVDGWRSTGDSISRGGLSSTQSPQPDSGIDDHFRTVPVDEVGVGDVVLVLPGEIVPVDGSLLSVSAILDLSSINGESVPREVFAGARVLSGAVNGATAITVKATRVSADSQYQRILAMVADAQESRAPAVRIADSLAVPFTVASLLIAGVAWALSGTPLRFAQVLVLATPCPLLIAAPVAFVAGTGRLARAGILVKSQDALEALAHVGHVFFDKTGTLTSTVPQVVGVDMVPGSVRPQGLSGEWDADRILELAGVVETYSVHILAKGMARAGSEASGRRRGNHRRPVVTGVREDAGNGIQADVDSVQVRVGRSGFVSDQDAGGVKDVHGWRPLEPDEMVAYVSCDGALAARVVMRDLPRANSRSTLDALRGMGVDLTMVTGDRAESARVIADEVGIDDVRADLLPQDKVAVVSGGGAGRSRSRTATMMVGDGVNDAPVLAAADVGMAMTDGTATAAADSAPAVIMNDDIASVYRALSIARRTTRVMLQAVVGGLLLALLGMVAAAFDLIPVVVGAFLQEGIDVVSILWALTALVDVPHPTSVVDDGDVLVPHLA